MKILRTILHIDEEKCDGCGLCVPACEEGAIEIAGGKARLVSERRCDGLGACIGECPRGALTLVEQEAERFDETTAGGKTPSPAPPSALSHWPVQIRLVPPGALFLWNARLLIAADCTAVAYPGFHGELLPGRVVLLGCPKFDDLAGYRDKFVEILKKNEIREITVCAMEVPCCQGLERAVREAVALSGRNIPVECRIVTVDGGIRS